MDLLLKGLIVASVLVALKMSDRFQSMSRDLDNKAIAALKRMMNSAEECGFPPVLVPLLMLLTALTFMLSMSSTTAFGR